MWYLHALRLRGELQGPDDPGTHQAGRRAYSLWRSFPPARALTAAAGLLATVNDVLGPASDTARRTHRAIAALPAKNSVSAYPTGAGGMTEAVTSQR